MKKNIFVGISLVCCLALSAFLVFADITGSLLPASEGSYLQWTPKSGSTHYNLVDEATCNGNTDYNYTSAVGNRDSYGVNISSIPDGSTITKIEISPCASKNSGGGSNSVVNVFYRYNSSNSSDSGNYSLSGTTPTQLSTTTFDSLSLIKSNSSSLQIGAVLTSGSKGAKLGRIATVITYTLLTAPSNLNATNISSSSNSLVWTDNSSNEAGFSIERSATSSGGWTVIATTTSNSYTDTGLNANQYYYYQVRAYNAGGYSNYSNISSAYTTYNPPQIPADPTNLQVYYGGTSTVVTLIWADNSNNETGFSIERGTDGINFSEIHTVGQNIYWYYDPKPDPGTYYYQVRAYNGDGYSNYTNTATTTIH
jgi:hypothetical protein